MKKNDIFIFFNQNYIYNSLIIDINKKEIKIKITSSSFNESSKNKVTAYIPYLERHYLDHALYILAQQGIFEIILVKTDFSQIKNYTEKDYARFLKILIQGCEEGKQYQIPILNKETITISKILEQNTSLYWFYENGNPLNSIFNMPLSEEYAFICGPERGFSNEEIILLNNNKEAHSIKLSKSILRSIDTIHFASILFKSI
jgi:RsmE family RNA methyltransferase